MLKIILIELLAEKMKEFYATMTNVLAIQTSYDLTPIIYGIYCFVYGQNDNPIVIERKRNFWTDIIGMRANIYFICMPLNKKALDITISFTTLRFKYKYWILIRYACFYCFMICKNIIMFTVRNELMFLISISIYG